MLYRMEGKTGYVQGYRLSLSSPEMLLWVCIRLLYKYTLCFIIYIDIQIQRYIVCIYIHIYIYYICINIYDKCGISKEKIKRKAIKTVIMFGSVGEKIRPAFHNIQSRLFLHQRRKTHRGGRKRKRVHDNRSLQNKGKTHVRNSRDKNQACLQTDRKRVDLFPVG